MSAISTNVTKTLRGLWLLLAILTFNNGSVAALFEGCDFNYIVKPGGIYELKSKNYPKSYVRGSSCRYRYTAPENHIISATCSINLDNGANQCTSDAFYIAVNGDQNLRNSERLCGAGTFTRESSSESLVLAYISKGSDGSFICTLRVNPCQCGWGITKHIANGVEVTINEYPSAVALTTITPVADLFCSATIISEWFMLTAAHCALYHDVSNIQAWVGRHNINSASPGADTRYARGYYINQRFVHEQYDPRTLQNDIALLRTTQAIQFSRGVGPICLPYSNVQKGFEWENVEVIGWGATSFTSLHSPTLQKITVLAISNTDCQDLYRNINIISPKQICTRDHLGTKKDSCQSDSGGPVIYRYSGRQYQIGVISYGNGCAFANDPTGVNTRVTSYLSWIYQHTGAATCIRRM